MRRILTSAVLAAALPGIAVAQDRPSLFDYFSLDVIAQRLLQSGIMGIRTQMDMKYSDMSVDFVTGKVTILDVVVWPLPEWDLDGTCEIGIERFSIRTGPLDEPNRARFKIQMAGVTFPSSCIPDEGREGLDMAGITDISMPRLTFDIDYGFPDSDLIVRAYADIEDVATVDMSADFAYFWFDGRDDIEEPIPIAFLRHGSVELKNRGIFEKLSGLAPPPFVSPGAGEMLKGMLGEELSRENRFANPPVEGLTPAQDAFLSSMATGLEAFLANPDGLVLETALEADVFVDVLAMEDGPTYWFDAFQPVVALAPASRDNMLPTALLQQALETPDALSAEDRKRVGLALMTGDGAPMAAGLGFELLEDMARDGDGETALAMARVMEHQAPNDAYRYAIVAGAAGEPGATAMLDRIEKKMKFSDVLEFQGDVSGDIEVSADVMMEVALMRAEAAKHLMGRGAPRSYEAAAMWAMLAQATGDLESKDILHDITERARLGGTDALKAWRQAEERASKMATEAWISNDLPARFAK